MDFATLLGLLTGIGLIIFAIIGGKDGMVAATYFWDYRSLLLVLGGTLAATFINYPLKNMWSIFKVLKNAFRRNVFGYEEIIKQFEDYAQIVRKKGLLALENEINDIDDYFLKNSIELAISEKNQDNLRNYLYLELSNMEKRHQIGQELFFYMGSYAPAFGMVGTIVGLIIMMQSYTATGPATADAFSAALEFDVATKFRTLLEGMGMALLTTFYGLILSNLIFIPIGGKLKRRSDEEIMQKEIMIEGVVCLHNRDHHVIVREKLNTFVPETERKTQKVENNNIKL